MVKTLKAPKGLPDRPLSPYLLWLKDNIEAAKVKYPTLTVTQMSVKMADLWKEAFEEVKETYKSRGLSSRVKFAVDMLGHLKTVSKSQPEPKTKKVQKAQAKVQKPVAKNTKKAPTTPVKAKKVPTKAKAKTVATKKTTQVKAKKVIAAVKKPVVKVAKKVAPVAKKALPVAKKIIPIVKKTAPVPAPKAKAVDAKKTVQPAKVVKKSK